MLKQCLDATSWLGLTEEISSKRGTALTEEAAAQVGKTNSLLRPHVESWGTDRARNLQNANKKMRSEEKHRDDERQPLLRSQSRRQKVDGRRNEDSDNEQNDTCDKSDLNHPVHRPGV